MKRTATLLLMAFISGNIYGQFPNWTKLNYDYSSGNYSPYSKMSISVSGNDDLYAFTQDEVLSVEISTDNGNTWNAITSPDYTLTMMPDNQGGVYRVKYRNKSYPDSVFYSSDQGNTWNFVSVSTNLSNNLQYYYDKKGIKFLHRIDNRGTIYLGEGTKGENFKYSDDNGSTWNTVVTPVQPFSALLASDGTMYISTYNSGVYVSTDGGSTWDNSGMSTAVTTNNLLEGANGEVYVVAGSTAIHKTTDQGQSWNFVSSKPKVATIKKMEITPDGMFYLQTSKEIYESSDGITWTEILNYPNNMDFIKDMAVSDNYVYAQIDSSLYRYQRQGGGGVDLQESVMPSITLYPNPGSGIFQVETDAPSHLILFDLAGNKVWSGETRAKGIIDISPFPSGTYMVKFYFENGRNQHRLLIKE